MAENSTYDIKIPVEFTLEGVPGTIQGLREVNKEAKAAEKQTKESTKTNIEHFTSASSMGSSTRMLSWDFMLLGRSLGIVNREMGFNNKLLSSIAGIMQLISSIMRIVIITEELYNLSLTRTNASLATKAVLGPLSAATSAVAATAASGGILPAAGIGWGAIGALMMGGFATGGSVLETGPYLLHKGESVSRPQDGGNYSNINVNMRTGAISNSIDVDRMIEDMTTRLALENRRRMG